MKYEINLVFALWLSLGLLSAQARAEETHQPPPDNSSAELKRIKELAGRWSSTTSMFGKPNEKVFVEFEVTAGGSAVLQRDFPGTPMEMISVYYDDNKGKLMMTHYCVMRNRPTFKLVKSSDDTMVMDVVKVEGVKSKNDPSMGTITLNFKDKDHFSSSCESRGKGADKKSGETMEFTRVKSPSSNAAQ